MCPLMNNYCKSNEWAWWDDEYAQCCMKSLIYSHRMLSDTKGSGCKHEHISKNEV